MLILSRERDEAVVLIGPDGIELGRVTVADIRGNKVRLGFEFPRNYEVHREEVADKIGRNVLDGREDL